MGLAKDLVHEFESAVQSLDSRRVELTLEPNTYYAVRDALVKGRELLSTFHAVMDCLERMELEHGVCERPHACSNCAAKARLQEIQAAYGGRTVSIC